MPYCGIRSKFPLGRRSPFMQAEGRVLQRLLPPRKRQRSKTGSICETGSRSGFGICDKNATTSRRGEDFKLLILLVDLVGIEPTTSSMPLTQR